MEKQINKKKISRKARFDETLPSYIMLAPFLIFFFIFLVLPIGASIVLSFTDYDMINNPHPAGLGNYLRMFLEDDVFPVVFKNTLFFAIICGPAGFLLSFVLAWFINEFSPLVRTLLSFMFYAPALVGNATFIWQVAFSSDAYGYINSALLSLGLITEPITWLSTEQYIQPIIIIVQLWSSMGVSFLTNISGLQNVNNELYEAGSIDGIRNRWQELWYITLPTMKHMLLFSAVMQISSAFSISGIAITLAGFPSVGYAADTIVSHMQDLGTVRYELGYASAVAVVLFLMMVFFRLVIGKLLNMTGK
ncbi:MAG: sugar ABC transporter permease [Ruminococcaceae bacterium]|nr:sugar ABC transporter permease [Oscillospiraceae bacterium]